MTPDKDVAAAPRVTIDDLRHRAERVKSTAIAEAKGAVDTVFADDAKRAAMIVIGVALVAASLAYYLGTRAVRCDRIEDF